MSEVHTDTPFVVQYAPPSLVATLPKTDLMLLRSSSFFSSKSLSLYLSSPICSPYLAFHLRGFRVKNDADGLRGEKRMDTTLGKLSVKDIPRARDGWRKEDMRDIVRVSTKEKTE